MSRPTKEEFVSSLHAKGFVPDGKGGFVKKNFKTEFGEVENTTSPYAETTPEDVGFLTVRGIGNSPESFTSALIDAATIDVTIKSKRPITDPGANAVVSVMLPFPPTVNRYLGVTRTGLRFKSKDGKDYCEAVKLIGQAQGLKPVVGKVSLTIHLFRPRKSGDLTNFFKVLEDSLEGILYVNDRQIVEHHAFLHDDAENPRCHVLCKELESKQQSKEKE